MGKRKKTEGKLLESGAKAGTLTWASPRVAAGVAHCSQLLKSYRGLEVGDTSATAPPTNAALTLASSLGVSSLINAEESKDTVLALLL